MLTVLDIYRSFDKDYSNLQNKEQLKIRVKVRRSLSALGYERTILDQWNSKYKGVVPLIAALRMCEIYGLDKNKYLQGY